MAVHKVIEILAQSEKGWEDAAQKAVDEASKSVKNIESVYIKEMTVDVENNKVTKYRINAKVTFRVE
jgi:flavin-binding protein dodecin